MERFVLAAVLVAVAVVVALLLERRRPDAPISPRWAVPIVVEADGLVVVERFLRDNDRRWFSNVMGIPLPTDR